MTKRHIRVVSAAIERDGRYLITQRMEKAVLPLLWEFPGGRVEDGETDEEALAREIAFRLGIRVEVGECLAVTKKEYPNYVVELHLYRCDLGGDRPEPVNVRDVRWVHSSEFEAYSFTPADEHSMNALLFEQ